MLILYIVIVSVSELSVSDWGFLLFFFPFLSALVYRLGFRSLCFEVVEFFCFALNWISPFRFVGIDIDQLHVIMFSINF